MAIAGGKYVFISTGGIYMGHEMMAISSCVLPSLHIIMLLRVLLNDGCLSDHQYSTCTAPVHHLYCSHSSMHLIRFSLWLLLKLLSPAWYVRVAGWPNRLLACCYEYAAAVERVRPIILVINFTYYEYRVPRGAKNKHLPKIPIFIRLVPQY